LVIVFETIGVTRFKKNFGFNNEAPLMDDFPSISEVPGMGQVKIVHPEVPLPRFVGFKEMENDENWCIAGSWFQICLKIFYFP
jgi:hypothetical protein